MALFIGVMTGTSIDGLDVSVVQLDPAFNLIASEEYPLPAELQADIKALARNATIDWQRLGKVDALIGEFIGDCVNALIDEHSLDRNKIAAIGSHGQTVHHSPDTKPAFTVQIGDASRICERTGLTVVSDFRRADMAAGGQGAPLVPPFHQKLFGSTNAQQDIVVCNIGGIANVTLLPADSKAELTGFDTGPGNALLDAWCHRHTGANWDSNGDWAASGVSDATLLSALLGDPFVQRKPPKSTGVEHYNLHWLDTLLRDQQKTQSLPALEPADIQATLSEFTAHSIANAVRAISPNCGQLIVCGGGRRNADLMTRLASTAPCTVTDCDAVGINGDALEAAAFAWLASQTLANLPGNAPSVTGATKKMRLGTITAPLG